MNQSLVEIDVSPMSLHHVDAVLAIERQIYPFPWSAGNFRDSLRAGYDAWVVAVPGQPSGAVLMGYAIVMYALDEAHLLNLSISQPFQRAGNGRRLLRWLMRSAQVSDAQGMFLEVRPSNEAAIRLYEQESFLRIGIRPNYYPAWEGRRENAIVMRRDLAKLSALAEPREP